MSSPFTPEELVNTQLVAINNSFRANVLVMIPKQSMTKREALVHAAWLVAIAEEEEGQFEEVLKQVKNT